jgi:hypothetical protein
MEEFIARQNIEHYTRLIEAERDPRQVDLLKAMLAEEEAKLREVVAGPGLHLARAQNVQGKRPPAALDPFR